MLHIRMLSGEELGSVPLQDLSDVRSLKQQLSQLHGVPPRFRQRLLLYGKSLDDSFPLDSPLDLELVLLCFAGVSQAEVDELANAAARGFMSQAGTKRPMSPPKLLNPNALPCLSPLPLLHNCRPPFVDGHGP